MAGVDRAAVSPSGGGRRAVEAVWRMESARIVGTLARYTRDFALAEDLALSSAADLVALQQMHCHRELRLHELRERGRVENEEPRRPGHPHRRLVDVFLAGDVGRPGAAVHAAL